MLALRSQLQNLRNRFLTIFKPDIFFFLFLLTFLFQLILTLLQCYDLVDDAYISARYARNFSQGWGLVYNRILPENSSTPLSLERVEGYSNFLWVILLALGLKLGLSVKFIAQFSGVIFSLISSFLVFLWVKEQTGNKWLGLIAVSFLATNLYFVIWQVEGLETPLFSLLLTASIYALHREKKILGMILVLLFSLTRPDGILLFFIIVLAQFFQSRQVSGQLRKTFWQWLWFIVPYLIYFLWRVFYYHSLLPNTFYAKTGLGLIGLREGGIYLGKFFLYNPGIILLIIIIFRGIAWLKRLNFSLKISLDFLLVYLLFIFLVGGDWMPGFRLLVPLFIIFSGAGMILLSQWLSHKSPERARIWIYLITVLVILFNLFQVVWYSVGKSFDKSWHRHQSKFYMATADWLLKYVWQNQSVALGDIGYIGYFADHDRIIDTTGLVDRHLGRLPGISSFTTDLDYIFSQKPFCIVSLVHRYPEGAELGHTEFDRKLAEDARLQRDYRLEQEIFGWESVERSRADWKKRESKVYFKIYLRN